MNDNIKVYYRNKDGKTLGLTSVGQCEDFNEAIKLVKECIVDLDANFKTACMAIVK